MEFYSKIWRLISKIVLARLLSPDDFGILGLVMVFVSIADVLVEGGLGNALIQKNELTNKDYPTVFTVNLIFSLLLFIAILLSAPHIEEFTNVKGLTIYLRVESICILIRAFYVVNYSQLIRDLLFKRFGMDGFIFTSIINYCRDSNGILWDGGMEFNY